MSRRKLFFRASGIDTDSFIIRVRTNNAGSSSSTQFTIPTAGTGYNYTVKTSDGQIITGQTGNCTITFPLAGDYDIKITGDFPRIFFNNGGDRLKLLEVKQWGVINWGTFSSAFFGCANAIFSNIPDVPIIASGTFDKLSGAFRGCTALATIGRLNEWNTAGNTSFALTFGLCSNFNQNIGNLNVASGLSFQHFLLGCSNFNNGGSDSIKDWVFATSGNIDVSGMFRNCTVFNQPLTNWNTNRFIIWGGGSLGMFLNAVTFNQVVGHLDFSNATSIHSIFEGCTAFNNGGSDNIKNINISNVVTARRAFLNTPNFTQTLINWRPSSVLSSATGSFLEFMTGKTPANYSTSNVDDIYNGWTQGPLLPNNTLTMGTAKHTAASTEARALLTRANATVAITNAVNNGAGAIRITATAHGLSTGNKCFISGVVGTTEANFAWFVTVIDANTIDLVGSTFTNAYISGGTLRTGYGWTVTDGGI